MNFRFPFASRDGGKTIEHSDADGAKHLPRAQGLANGLALVVQGGKWVASTLSGVSVASVFGRTGAVVAQTGDYTAAQVGALGATAQAVDSAKLEGHPASYFQTAGSGLALGETSSAAYRGDRGKTAYDHSQITGSNPHSTTAAQVGAIPVLDLTGAPATLDFNSINSGQPCIAAVQWTRDLAICHAPFDQANFGAGTLYQTVVGGLLTQMVVGSRWTSTPDTAEGSSVYTRSYVSGAWSTWHGAWSDANLVGTRNEHNHFSVLTKSASYDFANITASLIKHTNGDVVATLSGGVPGRSYTLVSVAALLIVIPGGVTLYGTSGIWDNSTGFSLGGMRPITIQCLSATEWLIPNYGE